MSEVSYLEDAAREKRIQSLAKEIATTKSRDRQAEIWHALKSELLARSPEQVRKMEAELGLD